MEKPDPITAALVQLHWLLLIPRGGFTLGLGALAPKSETGSKFSTGRRRKERLRRRLYIWDRLPNFRARIVPG
jgi:hypothetical protein